MDPQLEEYRSRQREKCAKAAVAASGNSRRIAIFGLACTAVLLTVATVIVQRSLGHGHAAAAGTGEGVAHTMNIGKGGDVDIGMGSNVDMGIDGDMEMGVGTDMGIGKCDLPFVNDPQCPDME